MDLTLALDLLIPIAALFAAFLAVWAVYELAVPNRVTLRQRVGQYSLKQAKPNTSTLEVGRGEALFRDRSRSSIALLDRFLSRGSYADQVALDLARAAVPLRVGEYLLIRWGVAVILFLLGYTLTDNLLFGLVPGVLGFFLPRLYVRQKEKERIRKVEDQLVDALTMMANALKAGSSFLQALDLVARELPPPIAEEFGQVVAEVAVGAPLDQALEELRQRVRSYDVYLIVTALTIQRNVGGNLAEVLQNIAATIRERQRLLRQVQVQTAEQRLSAYILMALPSFMFVVIAIINRPYLDPFFQPTGWGRLLLGATLVMQAAGYYIMRRIADIKV